MKYFYLFGIITVLITSLICCTTYRAAGCDEPVYPDQFPYNGCGLVEELTWDWDNSDMEIEASMHGVVSVSGGHGPYTWTLNGNGFYFDGAHTLKTVITNQSSATIFTDNACGPTNVTVTDACGNVFQNTVRSDVGRWLEISKDTVVTGLKGIPHTDFEHIYFCADASNIWCITYSSSGPTYAATGENGRYRVYNSRYHKYYGSRGTYASCDVSACSTNPPGYGHIDDVPGFPDNWCWLFGGNPPYNCDYIKYRNVYEWQCN